ncbi:hypothetical protein B0H14DRAFT_2638972 [Mycena olivaceomarginata]|nr:hypothetical protein B0H14DRAFT_2638972 [Mycena olivaceomarginata]
MTVFNVLGFFQLKSGRCFPTVKGTASYTFWHLHYNTHVWCTDNTSIAELCLYGRSFARDCTSFVVAVGHVAGPAETLSDGHSSCAFPISVNDYVANGTVSSTIQCTISFPPTFNDDSCTLRCVYDLSTTRFRTTQSYYGQPPLFSMPPQYQGFFPSNQFGPALLSTSSDVHTGAGQVPAASTRAQQEESAFLNPTKSASSYRTTNQTMVPMNVESSGSGSDALRLLERHKSVRTVGAKQLLCDDFDFHRYHGCSCGATYDHPNLEEPSKVADWYNRNYSFETGMQHRVITPIWKNYQMLR